MEIFIFTVTLLQKMTFSAENPSEPPPIQGHQGITLAPFPYQIIVKQTPWFIIFPFFFNALVKIFTVTLLQKMTFCAESPAEPPPIQGHQGITIAPFPYQIIVKQTPWFIIFRFFQYSGKNGDNYIPCDIARNIFSKVGLH